MIELSLFYNFKSYRDVLILVSDESAIPTSIEVMDEDFVVLKEDDRVIGINIFNSNDYVKIKGEGLIHAHNSILAELLHNLILDHTGYETTLVENVFLLGQVKKEKGSGLYLIDIGQENPVEAKSNIGQLALGDYVEVAYKETRLKTGHKAYHYLKNEAQYLIIENDLKPDICGTKLYKLKGEEN